MSEAVSRGAFLVLAERETAGSGQTAPSYRSSRSGTVSTTAGVTLVSTDRTYYNTYKQNSNSVNHSAPQHGAQRYIPSNARMKEAAAAARTVCGLGARSVNTVSVCGSRNTVTHHRQQAKKGRYSLR